MQENEKDRNIKSETITLLSVLGSAVAVALLFGIFLIYSLGPSGKYDLKNSLVNPEVMEHLSFEGFNQKTGGYSKFLFDEVTFSYSTFNQRKKVPITFSQYKEFYALINLDKSIKDVPQSVISAFSNKELSSLEIKVRTESHASWQDQTNIFQEVQLANDGAHYRVMLREEKNSLGEWVYFFHPGIKEKAMKIFIE